MRERKILLQLDSTAIRVSRGVMLEQQLFRTYHQGFILGFLRFDRESIWLYVTREHVRIQSSVTEDSKHIMRARTRLHTHS